MKKHYFIKFDRRVNKVIGCQRTTLIISTLEYWFSKKQDGFYKFIAPCSHPLYKKEDSWTEELNCDAKSFTRSFKKIGMKYKSRTAFEEAEDKFQGKMYASFYDRYSNRVFFVRNDEAVNKFFAEIYPPIQTAKPQIENKERSQPCQELNSLKNLLRNGKNSRSYNESNNSSRDLSKDKSHAGEIIKKMIEIWTALVQEGREQVILGRATIPFLKKAFTDKFDSCLEKWKKFCYDIASSRFLMGEKTSFRATLDWALKFHIIQKILEGNYGIGDRTPKAILSSQSDLEEEILTSEETQETKDFRALCLQTVGNASYISNFKNLTIEFREEREITLIAPHKFGADYLERTYYSYLRVILQGLGENARKISILAPGETKGRLIELDKEMQTLPNSLSVSTVEHSISDELPTQEITQQDEPLSEVSLETQALRENLRNTIPPQQFPSWLAEIEVEDIRQDGTVIVAFEDQLAVDWCRSRFVQEILQSATSLWKDVSKLIIRKKLRNLIPLPVEKTLEFSENGRERSRLEEAIQSFQSVCQTINRVGILGAKREVCEDFC